MNCFHILEEATQWVVNGDGRRLRATTAVGTSAYGLNRMKGPSAQENFPLAIFIIQPIQFVGKSCHCHHLN
jgi:hypothetical protein